MKNKRLQRIISLTGCIIYTFIGIHAQTAFTYGSKELETDTHTWIVNPQAATDKARHQYTSLKDALLAADSVQRTSAAGTFSAANRLIIYIAPWVYWLDDPDTPQVKKPLPGEGIPYGMKLKLSHISLKGMGEKPEHTILACNRGQTQGATGNFTMLHLTGKDITFENLTLGNYCNVDLVYPPNESLNRPKRSDAIVQAQLAIVNGDKVAAYNCRFISRLNTCPLVGAQRTFFDNCYFECTDDALCGTGIHHECRFTLFSGKPFYSTQGTGAIFLNCDIRSLTNGRQYLVKAGSPVTMVDCHWTCNDPELAIHWTQDPTDDLRSYQYNILKDGRPTVIDGRRPWLTVDMTGKELLEAYRLELPQQLFAPGAEGDTVVYNLYNLTAGDDGWNPARQPEFIKAYSGKAVALSLNRRRATIESGIDTLYLQSHKLRFMEKPSPENQLEEVDWTIEKGDAGCINMTRMADGSLMLTGDNTGEEVKVITLKAVDKTGLEAACILQVKPQQLPPPTFTQAPLLTQNDELLTVNYELDLQGRKDQSVITWYRASSPQGDDKIAVATSRMDSPMRNYRLSAADKGYYLLASISPKHLRSPLGKARTVATSKPVKIKEKKINRLYTDFLHFPTATQPRTIPGFWTVDSHKPTDTQEFDWQPETQRASWHYGHGVDGAAQSYGLIQSVRGARLLYTPLPGEYSDMEVMLKVSPCKTAGQGFGSATGQYMDIYIKMDTKTLTGYALRIIRTTRNDKAVDFQLMRYNQGDIVPISKAVSSICYRKGCVIKLKVEGNMLTADVFNENTLPKPHRPDLTTEVHLKTAIETNPYGGTGIQHTGSTGASATVLQEMEVKWNKK